ncbi:MAG: glycosyl hydrolase family 28-related protein [Opitutales bacterium]
MTSSKTFQRSLATVAFWLLAGGLSQAGLTVNVSSYGAQPNDGQDDTQAIRAAIAAVEANPGGGTVVLNAGEYTVYPQSMSESTIFHIRRSNIEIRGAGRSSTTLSMWVYGKRDPDYHFIERKNGQFFIGHTSNWNNGRDFAHRFNGFVFAPPQGQSTATIENVTIRDLRITGNATPAGDDSWYSKEDKVFHWDTSNKGISLGWGLVTLDNILIENVELDHFRGEIIYKGGASDCYAIIRNCIVHGTPSSAISGPAGIIENCEIYDCFNAAVETYLTNRSGIATQHLILRNNVFAPARNYPQWNARNGVSLQNDPNWEGTYEFGGKTLSYNSEPSTIEVSGNVFEDFAMFGLFSFGMSNAVIKDNTFRDFRGNALALWCYGNEAWNLGPHFENNLILRNTFEYEQDDSSTAIHFVSPWLRSGSALFVSNKIVGDGYPVYFLSLSGMSPDVLEDNYTVTTNTGRVGKSAFGNAWGGSVSRPISSGNYFQVMDPRESSVRISRAQPVADFHSPFSRIYTLDYGLVYGISNDPSFSMQRHLDTFPSGYVMHLQLQDRPDGRPIIVPASWWNDLESTIALVNSSQSLFFVKEDGIFKLLGFYTD